MFDPERARQHRAVSIDTKLSAPGFLIRTGQGPTRAVGFFSRTISKPTAINLARMSASASHKQPAARLPGRGLHVYVNRIGRSQSGKDRRVGQMRDVRQGTVRSKPRRP